MNPFWGYAPAVGQYDHRYHPHAASIPRGSLPQIASQLTKFIQADSSFKKNIIFAFSHSVCSQLIIKFAYMLDILVHHIVNMEYFDDTLPILQNFKKTI